MRWESPPWTIVIKKDMFEKKHVPFIYLHLDLTVIYFEYIQKEVEYMINIGSRRECFFDDYLINNTRTTAEFRVHNPERKGYVLDHDEPWEGDGCDYHNLFYDNGIWRMYYLGWWMLGKSKGIRVCYAESDDGVNWRKPNLGICEFEGSKDNNIIMDETSRCAIDNFMVFRDDNPACPPEKRYKGITSMHKKVYNEKLQKDVYISSLWYYYSADAIHFTMGEMLTDKGEFDSLNITFWDSNANKYRCYSRCEHAPTDESIYPYGLGQKGETTGVRSIQYMESEDFYNWTPQKELDFGDAEDVALYTNLAQQYYRAPHIYIGFPSRYIRRQWNDSYEKLCGKEKRVERMENYGHERYGTVLTDCVFMTSRDGFHFKRYDEAFIRPGPEHPANWVYGSCYPARGIVETASDVPGADPEMSFYTFDNHWLGEPAKLIRYAIRCDGFVSLHAGAKEKAIVTKKFTYEGSELHVNFSTSARGYIVFTLIDEDGNRYESCENFGDSIDRVISFPDDAVNKLSGKKVVLEAKLLDADLYSMQFC